MTTHSTCTAELVNSGPKLISPSQACNRLFCLLASWQQRSSERRRLLETTDRELRDMGISREQMLQVARRPFWQA